MTNTPPLKLSFKNFFNIFNLFSPMLVIFVIIFMGFINNSFLKLLYYLGSLSLGIIVIRILQNFLNINVLPGSIDNMYCSFWAFPFSSEKIGLDISHFILYHAFFFMLFAMVGSGSVNWSLFSLLLTISIFSLINTLWQCIPQKTYVAFSGYTVLNILFAVLLTFFNYWLSSSNPNMIFFSDRSSNNTVCNMPSRQTFKCSVYKNGELIKTL